MKIAFDISALSNVKTGVENYQLNLLNNLFKLDKNNFYILYIIGIRNIEYFKNLKFDADNYEIKHIKIPQKLFNLYYLFFNFPKLNFFVGDADVYHLSEIFIHPVKNAKTVAFVHDLTTLIYPKYHKKLNVFLHKIRFKRLKNVDNILCNSKSTKSDIVKYLKIDEKKIFVSYLAASKRFKILDRKKCKPILDKYNINFLYFLYVGTIEPRKNIISLIKAFNYLKSKNLIEHKLILVGKKGWLYKNIFNEINNSNYKDSIIYLNYISDDDLPAIMNMAELFVYPSFYEGFGLPILEAMQCGTPVITSDNSALLEVSNNACLHTKTNDIKELSNTILFLLKDKKLKIQLSKKGVQRAKYFSWKQTAERTLNVYNK